MCYMNFYDVIFNYHYAPKILFYLIILQIVNNENIVNKLRNINIHYTL
jgi:hypothetical protein